MNPRLIAVLKVIVIVAALLGLVMLFPKGLAFVEMAAQELRYFWWMIFLLALGIWLVWGLGSKKK
jgi:hypothetical protein